MHLVFIIWHQSIIVRDQNNFSFNDVVYDLQLPHDIQSFFEPFMLYPRRRILIEQFCFNLELIEKRLCRFCYEFIKTSCNHFLRDCIICRKAFWRLQRFISFFQSNYHFSFVFYGDRFIEESESYLALLRYCESVLGRSLVFKCQLQKSKLAIYKP